MHTVTASRLRYIYSCATVWHQSWEARHTIALNGNLKIWTGRAWCPSVALNTLSQDTLHADGTSCLWPRYYATRYTTDRHYMREYHIRQRLESSSARGDGSWYRTGCRRARQWSRRASGGIVPSTVCSSDVVGGEDSEEPDDLEVLDTDIDGPCQVLVDRLGMKSLLVSSASHMTERDFRVA